MPTAQSIEELLTAAVNAGTDCSLIADALMAADQLLRGDAGIQALVGNAQLSGRITTCLDAIDAVAVAEEARIDALHVDTATLDADSARLSQVRDASWSLRRDRLRTADAVHSLAGRNASESSLAGYLSIQQSLSALDRMEVRSRDSAGISVLVSSASFAQISNDLQDAVAQRTLDPLFASGSVRHRGATIVLFDGAPMAPTPTRLFDIAQDEKLDFFGVSAKFIDSANKEGLIPRNTHNLSTVKIIASTGSVLSPESFDYVYSSIKADVHLASMSGGTDICGCFLAGVPTQPVFRGELQGPCLGMATDVFNSKGESAALDEKGELVCTVPFPSKPIGFWNDDNNEKYKAAYFEGFPGVWTHGDFASKSVTGGFTLYGRSDATLNSKGVRIGTAEIYRVVETFPQVQEAMAVSQDWENDTRVILFVVVRPGQDFNEAVEKEIKVALRTQASPRHVPDLIVVAPELPRTKSNKLVELAVTDVVNGREVRNRDALANPDSLDWFKVLVP